MQHASNLLCAFSFSRADFPGVSILHLQQEATMMYYLSICHQVFVKNVDYFQHALLPCLTFSFSTHRPSSVPDSKLVM